MLRLELESAGYPCRWARDAAAGIEAFGEAAHALVLLDLMLPDQSGFDVLGRVRAISGVPVIVLTARHGSADKVRALDLGADDYVTKPFWTEELLARIRARLRRIPPPAEARDLSFGRLRIDRLGRTVTISGTVAHFSPTEFEVLLYLAERAGRSIRSDQILAALPTGDDATRTGLQTHVSRIRKKLGPEGGRIGTVWGIGYRFEEGP